MSMSGYTKLFNSILASTVWRETKETKLLWITMLAMADRSGQVQASVPGLADLAKLSIKETEDSLLVLMSPDPYSRTKDHEGRRLLEIDGGWQIINHPKYRAKMGADERREYLRIKQAEWRERKRKLGVNTEGNKSTKSTHTEAEAEAEAEAVTAPRAHARTLAVVESDVPPGGPSIAWADLCQQIWENRRGGENRFIFDLAPAFRKYGLEKLVKGWTAYLDSFPPGAKFVGSAQDFASKAGVWCEPRAEEPVSVSAQARAILQRDGMILRSEP